MNAPKVPTELEGLITEELEFANKTYEEYFHSAHEGWAILKEEVCEMMNESHAVLDYLDGMWTDIMKNNKEGMRFEAARIASYAYEVALEAIQVCAMARKFIDSEERFEPKE